MILYLTRCASLLNGKVPLKMKPLPSFTHHQVIPNQHDSMNSKGDILKTVPAAQKRRDIISPLTMNGDLKNNKFIIKINHTTTGKLQSPFIVTARKRTTSTVFKMYNFWGVVIRPLNKT